MIAVGSFSEGDSRAGVSRQPPCRTCPFQHGFQMDVLALRRAVLSLDRSSEDASQRLRSPQTELCSLLVRCVCAMDMDERRAHGVHALASHPKIDQFIDMARFKFQPCGSVNAIQQAVFGFTVDAPIEQDRLKALADPSAIPDYPRVEKVFENEFTVAFESDERAPKFIESAKANLNKVERVRFSTSGDPSWALIVEEDRFAVTTFTYSSWEKDRPFAVKTLDNIRKTLSPTKCKLGSIVCNITDEFWWTGDSQMDGRLLINEESDFVAKQSLISGSPLFHSYSGWFEEVPGSGQARLSRLHIDAVPASMMQSQPQGAFGIKIDHFVQTFFNESQPMSSPRGFYDVLLESAHARNLDVMRSILTKEALNSIGMTS